MAAQNTLKLKNKTYSKPDLTKKILEDKKKVAEESGKNPQVGGIILALLLFVVVGSSIIQIINNIRVASMFGQNAQSE